MNPEAYWRIQAHQGLLPHFWNRLDRLFDTASSHLQIRYLQIAGLSIRLECKSPCLLKYADIQLACCFEKPVSRPDAVFRVWHHPIASCLPPDCPARRVIVLGDQIQAIKAEIDQGRLYGFDRERKISYFCLEDDTDSLVTEQGYLLYRLFYHLAKSMGRIALHGAVIGYENRGALLCGNNGYGKSTLALTSLLEGCQYVGDDRAMFMKKDGVPCAWPLYSTASLNEEILAQLPQLQIHHRWQKSGFSKHILDISSYQSQFFFGLPIRVLLFPQLSLQANTPSLKEISPGQILTHLIWSTITQVDDKKDLAHIRNMLEFFKSLPGYQLTLCSDLRKNAKYLKDFIRNG